MGEIQHSLFISTHHFEASGKIGPRRKTGAWFLPFFSWNNLLPFPNQIPIGDPEYYRLLLPKALDEMPSVFLAEKYKLPMVMPKLNEELSVEERLRDYVRLTKFASDQTGSREFQVRLHPKDLGLLKPLRDLLRAEYSLFTPQDSAYSGMSAHLQVLGNASVIVSDYFGAHAFRANAFFQTHVLVNSETAFHSAIHPGVQELFEEFQKLPLESAERVLISKELLGIPQVKGPDELSELLFRPTWGPSTRRLLVAGYRTTRRWQVKLRRIRKLFQS